MALYGPAIPMAILIGPEGRREVHPASERWWDKIVELRHASQADLLRCPECDLRVVYVCEGVPTPYFKHYRDEQGCMDAGDDAGRQEGRARAWLRHHLVVSFRRALPAGTRRGAAPGPAETHVHPLRLGWEMKRQQLRSEREQLQGAYTRVLTVLQADGDRLLQGEILPVVEPGLYTASLYDWQTALLGFVWRAGVDFTLADAVAWLRRQGFVAEQNEYLEWENMRAFLAAAVGLGLIGRQGDGSMLPLERFAWPVQGASYPGVPEPAVCLVCATVKGDTRRKPRWRVFDPQTGLCKCGACRHVF